MHTECRTSVLHCSWCWAVFFTLSVLPPKKVQLSLLKHVFPQKYIQLKPKPVHSFRIQLLTECTFTCMNHSFPECWQCVGFVHPHYSSSASREPQLDPTWPTKPGKPELLALITKRVISSFLDTGCQAYCTYWMVWSGSEKSDQLPVTRKQTREALLLGTDSSHQGSWFNSQWLSVLKPLSIFTPSNVTWTESYHNHLLPTQQS